MKKESYEKMFLEEFKKFTNRYSAWNVWTDFLYMSATVLTNLVDNPDWEIREENFLLTRDRYPAECQGLFAKLLSFTILALKENPRQDFLGVIYHRLRLEQQQKGQFFTPYHICEFMSEITFSDREAKEIVEKKGYVSVNDPACGAGAMLIAFSNIVKKYGIDHQEQVLFVAQDIDRTAALMCYIQLTVLQCSAIVIVGDSLVKPGFHPDNAIWYTPTYLKKYNCFQSFFKEAEEQEIKKVA